MNMRKFTFVACILALGINNSIGAQKHTFPYATHIESIRDMSLDQVKQLTNGDPVVRESMIKTYGDWPRDVGEDKWKEYFAILTTTAGTENLLWNVKIEPGYWSNHRLGLRHDPDNDANRFVVGCYETNDLSLDTAYSFGAKKIGEEVYDEVTGLPIRRPVILWIQAAACAMINKELNQEYPLPQLYPDDEVPEVKDDDLEVPEVESADLEDNTVQKVVASVSSCWPLYGLSIVSGLGACGAVYQYYHTTDPAYKNMWLGIAALSGITCAGSAYYAMSRRSGDDEAPSIVEERSCL
ncbi:MAG: hypothetical protein LBJ92_02885 [Holosporales bacterium]|nr:hypothetical protein [Holosporales bacterium]